MLFSPLARWFRRGNRPCCRTIVRRARLGLERLEDRAVPANLVWVGQANGLWSTAANFNPAQVPGNNDTVIFAVPPIGADTNSKMDLGGGVAYHIAGLQINSGYTQTITITSNLWVDVLDMSGGTLAGTKSLVLTQMASHPTYPATKFGTSYFRGGTIQVDTWTIGEAEHRLTFVLAGGNLTPDLENDLNTNEFTDMQWTKGDVTVGTGKTITVMGTFLADSKNGNMGNNTNWNLTVDGGNQNGQTAAIYKGRGTFNKANEKKKNGGDILKVASQIQDGSPDVFVVNGTLTSDDTGNIEVQSGTLSVQGDVFLNMGALIVDGGQTFTVSGDLNETGDSVSIAAEGTLNVAGSITVSSGATFDMQGGTVEADAGLTIEDGAYLSGYGTIIGNVTNYGTVDVGEANALGTLTITGNWTNGSTGILNMEESASGVNDLLQVSGRATLGGTLNLAGSPGLGDAFTLLTFGSWTYSGALFNLPMVDPYSWSYNTSNPPGALTFTVVS
jgi:hypothetical protein